jgi:hypothetical protein
MEQIDTTGKLCLLPCPLVISKDLPLAAYKILELVYAFFANKKVPITHTNEELGRILGYTTRTVTAAIRLLQDKGMITVKQGKKRSVQPDMSFEWQFAEWDRVCKILAREIDLDASEDNNIYPLKKVLPEVMEVIEHWNSKEKLLKVKIGSLLGNRYEMTPSFEPTVIRVTSLLEGNLFTSYKSYRFYHGKPWTVEEVKQSIDNFYLAATSEDYYPQAKQPMFKKTLFIFLLNNFVTNPEWKSSLITYVEPPKPFYFRVKAEETKSLPMYLAIKEEILDTWYGGKELTKENDMKVVVIANRLVDWFEKHKKYLPSMPQSSMWASYVVEAMLNRIQSRGEATYLALDTMRRDWYWEYFTQFMQKKGILSTYAVK